MVRYQKKESEAATKANFLSTGTCEGCPKVNAAFSETGTSMSDANTLFTTIQQLGDLQKEVQKIKTDVEKYQKESKKSSSIDRSLGKLAATVRIAIIFLMVVPVLQLILCTGVVYALGIENSLPKLLKWFLSGLSLLSVIELFFGGLKLFFYGQRIGALEKKIENFEK